MSMRAHHEYIKVMACKISPCTHNLLWIYSLDLFRLAKLISILTQIFLPLYFTVHLYSLNFLNEIIAFNFEIHS